jgi:hypothetical protein
MPNTPQTAALADTLTAITGRVRVLSLAATGLGEVTANDDLGALSDLADRIEDDLRTLAEEVHPATADPLGAA